MSATRARRSAFIIRPAPPSAARCSIPITIIQELDFLRAHTPAGGVFVDVGANAGTYALPLARHVGPNGRVIAVEPHPVMVARLAFNRAASASGNVVLVAAAAGDTDGELMIETDHENYGASHVYPDASARSDAIRVPAMRLLRILQDQNVDKSIRSRSTSKAMRIAC